MASDFQSHGPGSCLVSQSHCPYS